MKKLHIFGLVVLGVVVNIGAMEPFRRIHPHDIIGQAYQQLNKIIKNASYGPTDWKPIFAILDSTPYIINDYVTPDGETLLEYALEEKNFAVAKRLLEQYHADPNRVVSLGDKTPLQMAHKLGHEVGVQEIIALLESYPDQQLNRIIRNAFPGQTDWKAIFAILDSTPNIVNDYVTPNKETLLEYALEERNLVAAKRLLEQYHADPDRVVSLGDNTPLQIARKLGHEAGAQEIIALLESYADEARAEGYGNLLEGYGNESGTGQ